MLRVAPLNRPVVPRVAFHHRCHERRVDRLVRLVHPARAACDLLIARGLKPHLLIHPDLAEDFADLPDTLGPGRALVVGDAGRHFTYDALNAAFLERGPALSS